jgi:hypothetical protein
VGLSPLYRGHFWPIVPAPDDRWGWLWSNWWNEQHSRTDVNSRGIRFESQLSWWKFFVVF